MAISDCVLYIVGICLRLVFIFLFVPFYAFSQEPASCDNLYIDLDGDLSVGAPDLLILLTAFGVDFDVDGDSIPDCNDDCVGAYDACGVCNGPGPTVLSIDTILFTYDSVYVEESDEWLVTVLDSDTLLHFICDSLGCTEPAADNYDPYLIIGGDCAYDDFVCGSPILYDGYSYATVPIGDQCWFAENLRTTRYSNGADIAFTGSACFPMSQLWQNTYSQARTFYGEYGEMMGAPCTPCSETSPVINACDPLQSLEEYGRLYNWYAVTDNRGLCPSGWVVPNNAQWDELGDFVSDQGSQVGPALKSQSGWADYVNSDGVADDGNGQDQFGFGALPGGVRGENGTFSGAGSNGQWWSRSPFGFFAYRYRITSGGSGMSSTIVDWRRGSSVRCVLPSN